jgi:peptide chain release factor
VTAVVRLLMSAGRGPRECAWAVARLAKRLEADARRQGVRTVRVEVVPGDDPGTYRSVLFEVAGADFAATWTGTLCWQGASPYRPGHGRKNWYVIGAPCSPDAPEATFDEADVDMVPVRTGGPGGQHRNKASTAVRATHRPSGTVVVVDTERQLSLNRALALRLLRDRLTESNRQVADQATTARWRLHDDLIRGNPVRTER